MKNLVGQSFRIGDGRYRIVDVQRLGGDALVYAELLDDPAPQKGDARPARGRTAFRYGDIAGFLQAGQEA